MGDVSAPNSLVVPNPETQYMGKPCKRGHKGLRWKSNRNCVECSREYQREYKREKFLTDLEWVERKRAEKRKARSNPAYRRKQSIYMMYWKAKKTREEYGNKGYTLGDDGQKGRRSGDRTIAV